MNKHNRPSLGRGNSYHHTFFNRSWYDPRVPLEHSFRDHPALVIPICEDVHSHLHRDLDPPIKPTHEQMSRVLGVVSLWRPEHGRLVGVEDAMEEFYQIGTEGDTTAHKRATMISMNLAHQLTYMEVGVPKERHESR